jgi:hypothetical protein
MVGLRDRFRAHFYEKGLALAPFSRFIDREDQEIIKASVGDQWEPGLGVWKTMADAARPAAAGYGIATSLSPGGTPGNQELFEVL